jgi:hypothetical protein
MPPSKSQSPSSEPTIQALAISVIRMDGGTQPRFQLYEEVVADYAEDLRQGATFPPVIVFWDEREKMYWLADGFHRVRAHEAIGAKEVRAEIHLGSRREAVLYSVGANAAHGLRRTNADKRRAVERLLRDDEWGKWSNREIARRCGVSDTFVGDLRRNLSSVQPHMDLYSPEDLLEIDPAIRLAQRGGTIYPINTTNIRSTSQNQVKGTVKRARTKKQPIEAKPLVDQGKRVEKGDTWKLGQSHYLFCGNPSSKKFQKLLPSEIGLFLIFLQALEDWPQKVPANTKNALSLYTSYGEDINLEDLRQVIEKCLSCTTDADDPVVIINLPDPLIFILMEHLYCPCYCAEPDPQLCTDALNAWAAIKQPAKKIE